MTTLDNLRKSAKRWLKALRAHEADAWTRFRRAYPDAPAEPGLRDVQHALARERGHENWIALKASVADTPPADTPLTALLAAADKGDASRVGEILDEHPALIDERGLLTGHTGLRTALHFGVHHESVVRLLLDRGANPNVRDEGDNAMPLHFVAESENFPIIKLLIEHGADPIGAGDGHELEVLGWATCFGKGRTEIVDYLIAHGARHNIFSAVATGEVEIIRALAAQSRADLDKAMDATNHHRRPLHLAVVKRQPRALETLLDLGADPNAEDAAGLTALDQAAIDAQDEMVRVLIDRGAEIGLPATVALHRPADIQRLRASDRQSLEPGGRWGTLIVRASAQAPAHVIEAMIRHAASVNVRDDPKTSVDGAGGYTPLHAAAWNGNAEAVEVLLKHGADPTIRDSKYFATPAGWANYAGHTAVRDLILNGPIDLLDAIQFDRADRIPGILERDPAALTRPAREYGIRGADEGMTPLAWAAAHGETDAARVLTEWAAKNPVDAAARRSELVARFLEFACWDHHVHGKGDHRMYDRAAERLLAQHPQIARDGIYTAIVCGELDHVRRIVDADPEAARAVGGSRKWTPLLYLCYTRFSYKPTIDNAMAIARLLLDRGANPNDFYMAGHSAYTALVGAAGEGEQGSPRQPYAEELFQLLLERGAQPFDIQVLYNTHFSGDMLWWLELVYEHTMKTGRGDAWKDPTWGMLGMGGYGPGAYFILRTAVRTGNRRLAEWALAHGARPEVPSSYHPKFKPTMTLYQEAVASGAADIADVLLRYGADPTPKALSDEEQFVEACFRLDREAVASRLETHPEYLRSPKALFAAAKRDRADVVAMLLDLGVPIEIENEHKERALHVAAGANALRVAKLLIERGAEVDPRETQWDSTPIGWAAHGDRMEMLTFLSRYTRNVWTLAFRGFVDRLREVLREDPTRAKVVTKNGITPLWWLPDDEVKALEIVEMLIANGADPAMKSKEGGTAADWALKRGMLTVARRLQERRRNA